MAVISGPKIQLPAALSKLTNEDGNIHPEWQAFLHSVQQTTFNITRSGPTASRPTKTLEGRYIGMQFFDVALQTPIYLVSTSPDIWKNAAGAVV